MLNQQKNFKTTSSELHHSDSERQTSGTKETTKRLKRISGAADFKRSTLHDRGDSLKYQAYRAHNDMACAFINGVASCMSSQV